MPPWLFGAARTMLQVAWVPVGAWLVTHDVEVRYLLLAVAAGVVTAVVQWAERRPDSRFGRAVRILAKIVMLWMPAARYPRALPATAPLAERGETGGRSTWRDG